MRHGDPQGGRRRHVVLLALALATLAWAVPAWGAAKVVALVGKAEVYDAVQKQWKPAALGAELPEGAKLRTDSGSLVTLHSAKGQVEVRVTEKTTLSYGAEPGKEPRNVPPGKVPETYRMDQGTGWYRVKPGTPLDVATPVLVASVRGTEFGVAVTENGTSSVSVTGGTVEVTDALGNTQTLGTGMSTTVSATDVQEALTPPAPPTVPGTLPSVGPSSPPSPPAPSQPGGGGGGGGERDGGPFGGHDPCL